MTPKPQPTYTPPPITPAQFAAWRQRLQAKMTLVGMLWDERRERRLRRNALAKAGA